VFPASLHDTREPDSSRSNTRNGRDRECIETGVQATHHHNLLPSFLGRRSFASPLSKGMIGYDNGAQIAAFLLRSSHSGRKFIDCRLHPSRQGLMGSVSIHCLPRGDQKCSTRPNNQTVPQPRMRSRKIATARHSRRDQVCVYPAIRDGWRNALPATRFSDARVVQKIMGYSKSNL
jgi:hypothetical protein